LDCSRWDASFFSPEPLAISPLIVSINCAVVGRLFVLEIGRQHSEIRAQCFSEMGGSSGRGGVCPTISLAMMRNSAVVPLSVYHGNLLERI
jgi:hypothetical protein